MIRLPLRECSSLAVKLFFCNHDVTQWWPCSPTLKSLWAEYFKLQWKAMCYSSALWISFRFYVCFICPRISRQQVSTDHATTFSELSNYFWTFGGGGGGGSTYYFAFYLTFISLRMTYRKYCQKKMCVSEHLLYTQIKNISMHIIINESWCLCSQCSQRSFKHKVSVQFLLAWNVTTLH